MYVYGCAYGMWVRICDVCTVNCLHKDYNYAYVHWAFGAWSMCIDACVGGVGFCGCVGIHGGCGVYCTYIIMCMHVCVDNLSERY